MLAWSPILIQKIEIHALGFVLRKLQLNRHRDAEIAPHRHPFGQLILYLSGEGVQTVGRRRIAARTGDLFVIPAGVPHGFSIRPRSRPLCLVLDYELEQPTRLRAAHRRLASPQLNELHALLVRVPPKGRLTLGDYSVILAVVSRLLEPGALIETPPPAAATFEKVRELLRSATPLHAVGRQAGYHPDHLTRKLKRETGLGLRAHREQLRLEDAQRALRRASNVSEAAAAAGFDDPNYFARWFRRKTGVTPSAWRRQSDPSG